jgi:hypothetical protein
MIPNPKSSTYNAIDRSKQYTRSDNPELLRSLNEAWSKIRRLEQSLLQKDVEIGIMQAKVRSYRLVNTALISICTGLAWEGAKFLFPIALRWIGLQ